MTIPVILPVFLTIGAAKKKAGPSWPKAKGVTPSYSDMGGGLPIIR